MKVEVSSCQVAMQECKVFSDFTKQMDFLFRKIPSTSQFVLLPELVGLHLLTIREDYSYLKESQMDRLSIFIEDYISYFSKKALERQQCIIAGSMLEESDGIYNTAYIFTKEGQFLMHRKTHIFPAESHYGTLEGDDLNIFEIDGIKIGIAICYEIEIPEIATMYTKAGADIIFCPSYTITPHGFYRVRNCALARSIENQIYVLHAPLIGKLTGVIQEGFGHAAIIAPSEPPWSINGVLCEVTSNETDCVTATLDLNLLYEKRKNGAATTFLDRKRRAHLYHI